MLSIICRRPAVLITLIMTLMATVAPLNASASGHHTATRTVVSFTSTVIEEIEPFDVSIDDAGIFHVRQVTREEMSGDISGTAIVTFAADFRPAGECTAESCFGEEAGWAQVEITTENGGWSGTYVYSWSDIPGEEHYSDLMVLRGTGANAHSSIVANSPTGPDIESTTFEGLLSSLATPIGGLNTSVRLCANPEDFSFSGGFLSRGAIEGSGGATGDFLIGSGPWTDNYAVAGTVTLTDAGGSVTIVFTGEAQDNFAPAFEASHVWGHFVILEGTGDYADLYGSGRVIGTAGWPAATCASGFGVSLSMIGEAHSN